MTWHHRTHCVAEAKTFFAAAANGAIYGDPPGQDAIATLCHLYVGLNGLVFHRYAARTSIRKST